MKCKKLPIFLLITFILIPSIVKAEDEFSNTYYPNAIIEGYKIIYDNIHYNFSNEVVFENGKYQLTGSIEFAVASEIIRNNPNQPFFYSCLTNDNSNNCTTVTVLYPTSYWHSESGFLGVELKNGEKASDKAYFYVGNDYESKHGIYTLKDYERHNISDINSSSYLSSQYKGKYFCPDDYGISCDNLVLLGDPGNFRSYAETLDRWQYLGSGYLYINGTYKLVNPKKILPYSTEETSGYTCISREESCENMYRVELGEKLGFRDGRKHNYSLVKISNTKKEKEIQLLEKENYDLTKFFTTEELNSAFSTNKDIIEIKSNKIVAKKIGKASIIYEDTNNYKELKVVVNRLSTSTLKNPETGKSLMFVFIITTIIIGTTSSFYLKTTSKNRK